MFDWFGISCVTTDNFCFYLQNRLIQTSQTGGQWYNDTSPFSISWFQSHKELFHYLPREEVKFGLLSNVYEYGPGTL